MRGLGSFLKDVWWLARPYFFSEERWSARGLLAAILGLNLSLVGLEVILNYWRGAFFNSLQDKDWHSFINLMLLYNNGKDGFLPGFCVIGAVYILVAVYSIYLNQWLTIRWRRWLTTRFIDEWLSDRAYYRISLQAGAAPADFTGVENPDQRIAEDIRDFVSDTLSLTVDFISNIVSLFSFILILWSLSGAITVFGISIPGYMVWIALAYASIGTWLTHKVGNPLTALNFRQQRVEADFRFSLVRFRENTEGIALYEGENEEHAGLQSRFEALIGNWWAIMRRRKKLTFLTAGYNQIVNIFPFIIAAPRYFAGEIPLGAVTQTAGAFGQVQGSLSWFVNAYVSLASWRAEVERLATFHRAIVAARAAAADGSGVVTRPAAGAAYGLEDATLALPDGRTLLDHATLEFPRGQSAVISGRSGSGKSTLFRALAGIWPFGSGTVQRPDGTSLFLPQRPYIPLGTLRHAVCYPAKVTDHDDAAVRAALNDVGLATLAPRLDDEDNWSQSLSGGEQQRLAIARALLARPDWLFLDEATASLDPESEGQIYAVLKRQLPGTTIVSIAHRPSVAAVHDRRLVFQRGADGPGRILDVPLDKAAAD